MSTAPTVSDTAFEPITISAADGSIVAKFVPLGATLVELWVKDKDGVARDVVPGYDDNSKLLSDPDHPCFNAIVGRYANRIKKGLFSIPISKNPEPGAPNTYQIPVNLPPNTLHGGNYGWDRREWNVKLREPASVVFTYVDEAQEGFPGTVTATATFTVSDGGELDAKVYATASEKTPILLTQHIYWNLDGFDTPEANILDHHLRVEADQVIDLDGDSNPTGKLIDVAGTVFDFNKPTQIGGEQWSKTFGLCGSPDFHQGYNHAWILDEKRSDQTKPITLWSPKSGIKVDISTNQPSVQVYTAFWLDVASKAIHGGPSSRYGRWSAVAIEQQGHVDAINTPEWGIDQIHGPERPYEWSSTYKFSSQ